jgi:hypothetical protein
MQMNSWGVTPFSILSAGKVAGANDVTKVPVQLFATAMVEALDSDHFISLGGPLSSWRRCRGEPGSSCI